MFSEFNVSEGFVRTLSASSAELTRIFLAGLPVAYIPFLVVSMSTAWA